jgi:hypothetical protein
MAVCFFLPTPFMNSPTGVESIGDVENRSYKPGCDQHHHVKENDAHQAESPSKGTFKTTTPLVPIVSRILRIRERTSAPAATFSLAERRDRVDGLGGLKSQTNEFKGRFMIRGAYQANLNSHGAQPYMHNSPVF